MNGKNHIINHRTEQYAKKLNIPEANIIDLRKKAERLEELKRENIKISEPTFSAKLEKWWSTGLGLKKNKITALPQEKVIISKPEATSVQPKVINASLPPKQPREKADTAQSFIENVSLLASREKISWRPRLLSFSAICLVIVIPIFIFNFYEKAAVAKGKVLGISSTALDYLQKAGDLQGDNALVQAGQDFSLASDQFKSAKNELDQVGGLVLGAAKLIPGKVQSADALLNAGRNISEAGVQLTELAKNLEDFQVNPLDTDQSSLTDLLVQIKVGLTPVIDNVNAAINNLQKVRSQDLPETYQVQFAQVQNQLPEIKENVNNFFSLSDVLLSILGVQAPKRYLFIFQNNREIRPTGGFIGSVALMDINKGKIEKLDVPGGGVYDLAGQLKEKIIAPKPLWLVNPYWNIQDSNWFPDFPTSAQKIMWFYERTGGTTVDGVISMTPDLIERLLAVVGPIDMQAAYGVTIDQNNFVREAQRWAEVTYDREENKPKKLIGDMLPLLLGKVFQVKSDSLLKILQAFSGSLADKSFLLYFSDATIQKAIQSYGWDGSILSADKDYLYVVDTNIGGGKTDQVIDQLIEHHAEIKKDGSVLVTVTVTRSHQGNPLDLWEKVTNVSYLRIYVPQGSQLISTDGFSEVLPNRYQIPDKDAMVDQDLVRIEGDSIIDEKSDTRISNEFGKTVFGNWLSVDAGKVGKVTVTYLLPFKLDINGLLKQTDAYSLLVQRQPGLKNNFLISTVSVADNFNLAWGSTGVDVTQNSAHFAADLLRDYYYGVLVKK